MTNPADWCRRITVLATISVAGLLLPTAASAHTDPASAVADHPLAKGKALVAVGGLSLVCCLAVVAAIAVTIVMVVRRRRR